MDEDCVIVVGSGLTGAIAALTLVEAGIPVVMLESGNKFPRDLHLRIRHRELRRPITPPINEHVPYAEFVNLNDCSTRWIKAHCVGGRSNFWSGIVLRYSEKDFQDGERLHPKYKWPISYQDLEPYYEKVEKIIKVRGGKESFETLPACHVLYERKLDSEWQNFARICKQVGRSLTVLPDVYGSSTILSTAASPQNVAVRIVGKLRRSKYFRLLKNAHVTRIEVDRYEPRASAVEYIDTENGSYHRKAAKAIVLAAGTLSSTQILLNSACKSFPQGLGNTQGLLGRYLHDHPLEYANIKSDFVFRRLNDREKGGLYITRESYAHSQPLQTLAFLLYGGIGERQPVILHEGLTLSRGNSSTNNLSSVDKCNMSVCFFGTTIPRAENYVSLHPNQKDCYGLPLLQISMRFSEAEIDNMKKAREFIPEIMAATDNTIFSFSSELEPPGTSVHYGGAVRMHHSPEYGVLDGWNRLHDIKNLLVVDASCFTTCVEKNPTLTAMAISMRAVEKLAQERFC